MSNFLLVKKANIHEFQWDFQQHKGEQIMSFVHCILHS